MNQQREFADYSARADFHAVIELRRPGRHEMQRQQQVMRKRRWRLRKDPDRHIDYILGARLRKVNEVKRDVLPRPGRYKEVYAEGKRSKDPAPLKGKEVWVNDNRYIVCVNTK